MLLHRRTFFQYGLGGSICLALGGVGLSLQSTIMIKPPKALTVFNPREYSILYAIANRLLPKNQNFPSASTIQVAWKLDQVLSTAHPSLQAELKMLLALIENAAAALLLSGSWKPFTQCSSEQQDDILQAWRTSSLSFRRSAILSLNRLCGAVYYADPATFSLVGYGGPPKDILQVYHAMRGAK